VAVSIIAKSNKEACNFAARAARSNESFYPYTTLRLLGLDTTKIDFLGEVRDCSIDCTFNYKSLWGSGTALVAEIRLHEGDKLGA
jgi:hypothetical protein